MWDDNIVAAIHNMEDRYNFRVETVPELPDSWDEGGLRGEDFSKWGFCFACHLESRIVYIPDSVIYDETFVGDDEALAAFCHEVGHVIAHADAGKIEVSKMLTIEAQAWMEGLDAMLSFFPPMSNTGEAQVREFICKAVNTYWNRKEINNYAYPIPGSVWFLLIDRVGLEFSAARNLYVIAEAEDE